MNFPRPRALLPSLLFAFGAVAGCDGPGTSMSQPDLATPTPDMAMVVRQGTVRAAAASFTSGPQTNSESAASALFLDTVSTSAGCKRSVQNDCVMYHCTGTGFAYPAAGALTVAPKSGGNGLSLSAGGEGYYGEQRNTSAALFTAGQAITFTASGAAGVPAFTTDVMLPSEPFTISNPSATRLTLNWLIPKANDFKIDWSTTSSKVIVELSQGTEQAYGGVTIRCSFAGSAGTGTIPASMLANLKTAAARIVLGPGTSSQVTPAGWQIDATVIGVGRSGDVTIQ